MIRIIEGFRNIVAACAISMLIVVPVCSADPDSMADDDEILVIEDGDTEVSEGSVEEAVIEDGAGGDELVIEEGDGDTIVIDTEDEGGISEDAMEGDELVIEDSADEGLEITEDVAETKTFSFKVDDIWIEYGYLGDSNSRGVDTGYLHTKATAQWIPSDQWEFQLSARLDGYSQSGRDDWDKAKLDYDESFVRYRSEETRITLGTQKIIWGRIDEFPPTDRLSTYDLTRYILDDLADRRRASPALRIESFFGDSKLDLVYLPTFREAELPSKQSVWYPVNSEAGKIFGLKSTPATSAIIQAAPIDDSAPDSDGGFGARFSGVSSELDYSVSVQRVRQSTPYFSFNPGRGVLEAKYPRSWIVGGDLAFEANNATWRLEAAWSSDTPVTRVTGSYTTVNSLSWGMGVEFYPGDGDARVNLQLTGINLINQPSVSDRSDIYALNGSFETPFADDQWRAKTRFYVGLDEKDVYLNPEIAYTGWESQEVYLEGHYFNGADGTPGGYHEDHSIITLGWRAKF
jgi:hypothetical protein